MTIDDLKHDIFSRQITPYQWFLEDGSVAEMIDVGHAMRGIELFIEELKRRSTLDFDSLEVM